MNDGKISRSNLCRLSCLALLALGNLVACGSDIANSNNVVCTPGPCQLSGVFQNGVCVYTNKPDNTACDDNNTCATNKACQSGACLGTPQVDGTPCDDHNACTKTDACVGGVCVGTGAVICAAEDICHYAGVCDPNSGCISASKGPCSTQLSPLALSGCPPGDYATQVTLGGSQTVTLIADSGSSTLAVAASSCSNCSFSGCGNGETGTQSVSPTYVPGPTAQPLHLTATGTYGDNSGWSGSVYVDTVAGGTAASPTSPTVSMRIVSITQNSNFFSPSYCILDAPPCNTYQGILGLGGQNLAARNTDALMPRLAGEPNSSDAFSVQLCNNGGRLWYGGYDPNATSAVPQFVPMVASDYYALNLTDLGIAGISLGMNMTEINPTIVDTGTSDFMVVDAIYNRITSVIAADANFIANFGSQYFDSSNSAGCVPAATGASMGALDVLLPRLSLTLTSTGGSAVVLTLPATQSYLVPVPDKLGHVLYCPGIGSLGPSSSLSIMGAAFMRGMIVIFDGTHQQIGFAPGKNCLAQAPQSAVAGP